MQEEPRARNGSADLSCACNTISAWAAADEEQEILASNNPGISGDDRDARFRWQESEANLMAGYRWGSLKPMAGIAYSDFRLHKWWRYHISETGLSGAYCRSSVPSMARRVSTTLIILGGTAGTGMQDHPAWALVGDLVFAGYEDYNVAVRWSHYR